jgi:hypothetical protein
MQGLPVRHAARPGEYLAQLRVDAGAIPAAGSLQYPVEFLESVASIYWNLHILPVIRPRSEETHSKRTTFPIATSGETTHRCAILRERAQYARDHVLCGRIPAKRSIANFCD